MSSAAPHAGMLTRRVGLERRLQVVNGYNEPVETFVPVATVWAHKRDVSASEAYRAAEVGASISTRWLVRYGSVAARLQPFDRLAWRGEVYNITGVREVDGQRNKWLEIDSVARADVDETTGVVGSPVGLLMAITRSTGYVPPVVTAGSPSGLLLTLTRAA